RRRVRRCPLRLRTGRRRQPRPGHPAGCHTPAHPPAARHAVAVGERGGTVARHCRVVATLPGRLAVWSPGYLHQLAQKVDQVAFMRYDTALPPSATYAGYVRRATKLALGAVPGGVGLLIGVPAYHEDNLRHHDGTETMAAALRGVRLALGTHPPHRDFGVAV